MRLAGCGSRSFANPTRPFPARLAQGPALTQAAGRETPAKREEERWNAVNTLRFPWMSRFLNLSAPAILLASAFGADSLRTEAETPTVQEPEVRQVVPHNGFTIQYLRREAAGPATSLWLGGIAGAAYAEIAGLRVEGFEGSRSALRVGPAAPDGGTE